MEKKRMNNENEGRKSESWGQDSVVMTYVVSGVIALGMVFLPGLIAWILGDHSII